MGLRDIMVVPEAPKVGNVTSLHQCMTQSGSDSHRIAQGLCQGRGGCSSYSRNGSWNVHLARGPSTPPFRPRAARGSHHLAGDIPPGRSARTMTSSPRDRTASGAKSAPPSGSRSPGTFFHLPRVPNSRPRPPSPLLPPVLVAGPSPFSPHEPSRNQRSQAMSRKRPRLVPETFGSRRRRGPGGAGEEPPGAESGSVRRALRELGELFPRRLFQDALPPIALKSQVYSLVPDRTAADRQLRELREQGEIRVIQLGFDSDAQGIVFTEDFRTKVQLVNAGVLTVRDAGSWWLSVPGAGRFVKYFVKGRQAVLGMVRKSKYRELSLSELLGRRAPLSVRLGLPYHVHDLIGGQLLDIVPTTSGTLLRLPET
ncbi:serine/threonine-protein kinase 19 isoform X1 [Dromiciops gliroides]|uniref:serine/threonine-protein kinase 19 isoform X1 n=1 Tax=Dromiciops gliroides TaxID=33562 RepID=UPI001CC70249|nr:serine/threonine-protein kinase 19 isoform X1 [Dromiciops gliroides]